MEIDIKYKSMLLEALEDKMYALSLKLNDMKGESMTPQRKKLTRIQKKIEKLQHLIATSDA